MFERREHLHFINEVFIVLLFFFDSFARKRVVTERHFEDGGLIAAPELVLRYEVFIELLEHRLGCHCLQKGREKVATVRVGASAKLC